MSVTIRPNSHVAWLGLDPELEDAALRVVVATAAGGDRLRCRADLAFGGFDVVAEAVHARQAVALGAFEAPDVVLLDPDLPNDDASYDVTSELAKVAPHTRVVAFDPAASRAELRALLRAASRVRG
jgi:DNA-binding NarL/FixJ family response regulator